MTLKSIVILCASVGTAFGQTKKETTVTKETSKETTRNGVTVASSYQKSSEVIGKPIITGQQNIGKVEDLVVDAHTGRVVYGIGSYTDSTGKLYAIPWPAGTYSTQTRTYQLNVEPDQLRNAPTFTSTDWPNFTDDEFATKTFKVYNQTPYWHTEKTVVRTSDSVRPSTVHTHTWAQRPSSVYRVSELRGRNIRSQDGVVIGQINEVVLDPDDGRILYGITTRDGQSVPIPWTALHAKGDDFELTIAADRWKTAPVVKTEVWTSDPQWSQEVYRYYDVTPVRDSDDDDDD